ncbi:MAG: hypothetical protein AAF471_05180 [Myxococcota bacterium]
MKWDFGMRRLDADFLPERRDAINRVSTNRKCPKVDSRVRGNDKRSVFFFVGSSFSSRFEACLPTLSSLRKRESTEKAPKSGSDGWVFGRPFSRR